MEIFDDVNKMVVVFLVHACVGLIEYEERGIGHKRLGQAGPLKLTTREFGEKMMTNLP